jgi:hypothetical protein
LLGLMIELPASASQIRDFITVCSAEARDTW